MSKTAKRDTDEMRYLLEDLSEDEKNRMEDAFFADDSKFEAVELAEDDLIDAYVRNELSPEEQRQFKAKLLSSPRILERVNFAKALAEKADSFLSSEAQRSIELAPSFTPPADKPQTRWWGGFLAQRPAWGLAMAACALLILVAGFVLLFGWLRLRNESERLASERAALERRKEELDKLSGEQRSTSDQQTAELQRERDQLAQDRKRIEDLKRGQNREEPGKGSTLGSVVHLLLTPGGSRSSGAGHDFPIGPEASTVKLDLALERNDYRSYIATIETPDGKVFVSRKWLKAHNDGSGQVVTVQIPVRLLPPNNYNVTLKGVASSGTPEDVGIYSFRVLKRK